MSGKKQKFYVVWHGHTPGVYTSWDECLAQITGFKGSAFKSFATREEAEREFMLGVPAERSAEVNAYAAGLSAADASATPVLPEGVERNAIAVDAACSGNPGMMEYRGVMLDSGREVFHFGPVWGTNNIGEFLAIVHALALMKKKGVSMPVYSDSRNGQLWVRKCHCATKLERTPRTEPLYQLIERAEQWLKANKQDYKIIKWDTKRWGEIPADFGRKH